MEWLKTQKVWQLHHQPSQLSLMVKKVGRYYSADIIGPLPRDNYRKRCQRRWKLLTAWSRSFSYTGEISEVYLCDALRGLSNTFTSFEFTPSQYRDLVNPVLKSIEHNVSLHDRLCHQIPIRASETASVSAITDSVIVFTTLSERITLNERKYQRVYPRFFLFP